MTVIVGLGDADDDTVTEGVGDVVPDTDCDGEPLTDGDVVPVTDSVGEPVVDGETEVVTLTVADTDCEVVGLTCGARDDGEARTRREGREGGAVSGVRGRGARRGAGARGR